MKTKYWSLVLGATVLVASPALAADHVGRVTLANGVPVPGARVTATQGANTLVTTTDTQGGYRFTGIADGAWSIQVDMIGLSAQKRDVTIAAGAAPAQWQLSMLPFAEMTRGVTVPPPAPPQDPARRAAQVRAEGRASGAGAAGAAPVVGGFQRAGVAPGTPPANPAAAAAAAAAQAAAAKIAAGAGRPGGPAPGPPAPPGDADALLVTGTTNAGGAQPSVGNVNRPTGLR